MSDSPHVFEVTGDNYASVVIQASHEVPVLVDFWAEWCAPCQMQLPILLKLVEEYAGKFVLAKLDTDRQREIAAEHNIRSIPTMKLYRNGEIVEEILGAQTESTLRAVLDRYVERPADKILEKALQAEQAGHPDEALELLGSALQEDPGNPRVALERARILVTLGQLDGADEALKSLPREVRDEEDADRLRSLLEFAHIASEAPSPEELEARIAGNSDDYEARYQLAARQVIAGRHEAAMDQLLDILQRNRDFREDAGRKGLLSVFKLLGNEGELVNRYRSKLVKAMY